MKLTWFKNNNNNKVAETIKCHLHTSGACSTIIWNVVGVSVVEVVGAGVVLVTVVVVVVVVDDTVVGTVSPINSLVVVLVVISVVILSISSNTGITVFLLL